MTAAAEDPERGLEPRATRVVGAGLEREVVGQLISVPTSLKDTFNPSLFVSQIQIDRTSVRVIFDF